MDYLLIVLTLLAAVPAYTYGFWLKQNGNAAGDIGMKVLIVVSLGLAFYNLLKP
ncbi:hypothetical protein P22_1032 [Propionispora sp. 2/2-37]|uniref:hypothetical protein n=1 Tax=Propionispora sp. 2/2-37 TaxID=1677858 RepID=UPI0006C1F552|nr:hypothetical protein [Propionispora sp. 2/2-37]CUH94963.1 hypothetical protein P22_1032 [Propionispora sp. 2/2-37]